MAITPSGTAPGAARRLTLGEIALARSVYGDRIDLFGVEIRRRKWAFFQPRQVAMAPCGHIHFHPHGDGWRDDFAEADINRRGLFVHELAHVWQWQRGIYLPLARAPFCRYSYTIKPGWPLVRYGLNSRRKSSATPICCAKAMKCQGRRGWRCMRVCCGGFGDANL